MDRFTASALCLLVGLTLIVLGIADVGSSSDVMVIVGAALVLAPLGASFAPPNRTERS